MNIALENIRMMFGNIEAIENLNITIEEGKLVTFLGPSGCGKSTTLFLIAGLYKPKSGEIYFNHELINNILPEKRNIGMVFQNYALYPHMTVLENILFPLKMQKMDKAQAVKKGQEIAELVKIKDLLYRKPSQLSGGQQQRVAIARALVKEPDLLLLDEPLSNLDARLRVEMREEIRRIQKKLQITTVFVTHDQEEALSISDKVILLNEGKLQQYGTPEELYRNPKNLFTAKFLGNPQINVFNGTILEKKVFIEDIGCYIPVDDKIYKNNLNNKCKVGIRPEDLIFATNENFDFQGEIQLIENIGKDSIAKIKVGNGYIICIFPYDTFDYKCKKILLKVKPRKIHLFNFETNESF